MFIIANSLLTAPVLAAEHSAPGAPKTPGVRRAPVVRVEHERFERERFERERFARERFERERRERERFEFARMERLRWEREHAFHAPRPVPVSYLPVARPVLAAPVKQPPAVHAAPGEVAVRGGGSVVVKTGGTINAGEFVVEGGAPPATEEAPHYIVEEQLSAAPRGPVQDEVVDWNSTWYKNAQR
ncbi:MAG: hypothetical protein ACXWR4_17945 [Bdellovibrionota bacterium]